MLQEDPPATSHFLQDAAAARGGQGYMLFLMERREEGKHEHDVNENRKTGVWTITS